MKRKTFLLIISMILCTVSLRAQNFVYPSVSGKTSFAVITDSTTAQRCASAVSEYKQTIESEGLPVYVVSSNWKDPDEVRAVLKDLYVNHSLEGCVLVGEVPIAMVTKAQFLTSAFKMDERKYPIDEVAVPSDRFYDDFDLKFERLDTIPKGNHFYYDLAPDSLPYIESDIYSARIVPQSMLGDPYEQISAFLRKASHLHKENNPFDNMVSYTGRGSYSDSIIAWKSEQQTNWEQFGDTFRKTDNLRLLRYNQAPYMKENLIHELQRDEVDMMAFHEHGDYFRMYLGDVYKDPNSPEEYIRYSYRLGARRSPARIAEMAKKAGLDSTWYADYASMAEADSLTDLKSGIIREEVAGIAPNARFVFFDACYNGDFRNDDFIAGEFVMSGGNCVATWANSVNVLQDKSSFDLLGLLKQGVRIGNWARYINILESHIIGDPTFRFTPVGGSYEIDSEMTVRDAGFWASKLDDALPDVQCVALKNLVRAGYPGISDILLAKYKSSPYAVVRYECMLQLQKINDSNYRELLKLSQDDNFEFIRRVGTTQMANCGDDEFAPVIVRTLVEDRNSERVYFDAKSALQCFSPDAIRKAADDYFKDKDFYHADAYHKEIVDAADADPQAESLESIKNGRQGIRIARIQFLRNEPYHGITSDLIKIMQDPSEDILVRTMIAESFAWYRLSCRRAEILDACRKLLADPACPQEMKTALTSACTRLSVNAKGEQK